MVNNYLTKKQLVTSGFVNLTIKICIILLTILEMRKDNDTVKYYTKDMYIHDIEERNVKFM